MDPSAAVNPGVNPFETTWLPFLLIITSYVVLCLVLGAKKVYFEPYVEPAEEKEVAPNPQA